MLRYHQIDSNLFIKNREKLEKYLKPNSLVVLNANDVMPTNGDGVMPFCQNSDLFYFTGIDQEETKLVLYPDAPKKEWKALLFIRESNEQIAIWEGIKHTQETAKAASGIDQVHWLQDFASLFNQLAKHVDYIYLNSNEHLRANTIVQTRDQRFARWCKTAYPLHHYERLAPIMHKLRMIKSEAEIEIMRQACKITEKGIRYLLPRIKPGIMEFEIEAMLSFVFLSNRSRGFAYAPIVASGSNACILHYGVNNKACQAGETILLDVGAEYANYCADSTRVIPVNGRFTARQRAVYNALLGIMDIAKSLLKPGNDLITYQQAIGEATESALLDLKLLTLDDIKNQDPKMPAYKKYFMHGVSHHIGLNVHDVADPYQKFEEGMVFTIEPGIYIKQEGLGMRLEDDFVIRQNGLENLMSGIPIHLDEIEQLMNEKV